MSRTIGERCSSRQSFRRKPESRGQGPLPTHPHQDEQEQLAESLKGVIEGIGASVRLLPRESDQGTDIWAGTLWEDEGSDGRQ